jgi:dTDP-4-dehydrorhamnose reductase
MMRILVTGVTGQVGGALVAALRPAGVVMAADRAALDLARPEEIAATLGRLAPELIINPAAYTAVDRAEDERDLAFRVNGEAPGIIARWAAARAVPIIHFSTDYVFDGSGARPWREDDRTGPLSAYGASKLAGEEAVRAAGGAHLIIRTSWVYAAKRANFLRSIARLARERPELRVVADQFGAPTSARLIAAAVAGIVGKGGAIKGGASNGGAPLAERFAASGGLVNVAASGVTSWHGFAAAIVEGLKRRGVALAAENVVPIRTGDYPTKARRPANSRFDLSRLSRVFGIETPAWDVALAPELDRLADELAHSP